MSATHLFFLPPPRNGRHKSWTGKKNNEREKEILKPYRVRGFPESRKYPLILMASYPEVFGCLPIVQIARETEVAKRGKMEASHESSRNVL